MIWNPHYTPSELPHSSLVTQGDALIDMTKLGNHAYAQAFIPHITHLTPSSQCTVPNPVVISIAILSIIQRLIFCFSFLSLFRLLDFQSLLLLLIFVLDRK